MTKNISLTMLTLFLFACQQSPLSQVDTHVTSIDGVTFLEQVKARPGETQIPYQKYQLDNGLTVLLHKDTSDPLVHVDVTYHVGSAREEIGKSGFAHLFEHMMFQGSENVADEQHIKLITEAGGSMNGTTNSDRTNYFETVPANQLEKMLWLESDRMGYLLKAVTQDKFEVQRETVKNERGQRIDNVPYGRLRERIAEALFPREHPYSWPVIGYMEDLDRVNVNDLKAFFMRWYGPNNATITIGGDFNETEALTLVKQYFSPIPKGPEVVNAERPLIRLDNDRYISMEDNVHLPLVTLTYPTVYVRHQDEAPLDILSDILGDGKTSIFYKNLVKNRLTVDAGVSHPCAELACRFMMYALPHPAARKSLKDIEKVIRDSLAEFEARGVTDEDLQKSKAKFESQFIFGLQSVSGKVSQLAAYETFTGNPNYITEDIARYNNVTKQDVMRVYRQYIKDTGAVVMSVVPMGKGAMIAAADNYQPAPRNISDTETPTQAVADRRGADTFDRSTIPQAGANKPVSVPPTWQTTLDNGIRILGTVSEETPTTSILLKIPAGHYYETASHSGIANLTAQMLNEATTQRSAEEMSKALAMLGSSVSISSGTKYISVNISTLSKNLDATLALAIEKLTQPALQQSAFERIKQNAIQGVINNKKSANYLARRAFNGLLYQGSIGALPEAGTVETLGNITLDDVKNYYQQQIKPMGAQLISVSDLSETQLKSAFAKLLPWQGKGQALTAVFPKPEISPATIYLVDKKNAAQSVIRIGKRSLVHDMNGEYFETGLMNYNLGGAFNSRINMNLREEKGYTYGANSTFYGNQYAGIFLATAEVRADVTDKSLIEFFKEIKNYRANGVTDSELSFMRNAINQKDALKYETPSAKLGFLAQLLEYNVTADFVNKRNEIVSTISKQRIDELAKKHLNIDDMVIVVVGDAQSLRAKLTALGYPVVDYAL